MSKIKLMGILNVTPDSFYDGNRYFDHEVAIKRGVEIYQEGADIIDIGGESTRPGSVQVNEEEERERVTTVIQNLKTKVPIPLSIDTMKPLVAEAALKAGASLINDVSGFNHPKMREIAAEFNAEVCIMHMLQTPQTMQDAPFYPEGIISHLLSFFDKQITLLIKAGVKENKIIIDPGIGFGKTVADNLEIIHNLQRLKPIGFPLLVGVSRKSFMSKLINKPASDLLNATLTMNTIAILSGADIIRVHDIKEHYDVINLLSHIENCRNN
jgi:dihydropteroate synthase